MPLIHAPTPYSDVPWWSPNPLSSRYSAPPLRPSRRPNRPRHGVITITGIGDQLRLEWPITITGTRTQAEARLTERFQLGARNGPRWTSMTSPTSGVKPAGSISPFLCFELFQSTGDPVPTLSAAEIAGLPCTPAKARLWPPATSTE